MFYADCTKILLDGEIPNVQSETEIPYVFLMSAQKCRINVRRSRRRKGDSRACCKAAAKNEDQLTGSCSCPLVNYEVFRKSW